MTPIRLRILLILALVALAAGGASLLLGPAGAVVVLAAALGWIVVGQERHLARLRDWASGPVDAAVPEGRGAWEPAFDALHRRVRTRIAERQDLADILERFRTAVEALPDGMVILDPADDIVWCNPAAEVHLGVELASDRGEPLANFVRQPEFLRYLEAGDFHEPVTFRSSRDAALVLSVQIVPYGQDQRLLMTRNITRIEEAEQMRRDFIANVSHELKTPLTVLVGFLETIEDLKLDAGRSAPYIRMMSDQAQSMQRLVDDLLVLSALESDEKPLRDEDIDVPALIREVAADAEALSRGDHTIVVEAGSGAHLRGARDEVASALRNLASNAVRYTPTGGRITMRWRRDGDAAILGVSDTGAGIAAEHIPRLTERFYRVDRGRSRATGGTGLGLAIVKHVLIRHQAHLEIDSAPGRGSTFAMRFPPTRVLPDAESPRAPRASAEY